MASYNKVILMGNVVRNPELRHTPGNNLAVARTSIAVNSNRKDREEVMFIDIVLFGKSAETLNAYATKGSPLLVDGRLSLRSWDDPNGGGKRHKHEIIVDNFQLLRGSKERSEEGAYNDGIHNAGMSASGGNSGKTGAPSDQPGEYTDDDIPF
ncbi:MAG: single-stranded DNA-binding protein [Deferribacteraceae bacterium]|jgi:single-strand DNA-binding protein|nr:single-stranded DNA-binding protein [Deferribacteraceae bacterium]